MWVIGFLCLCFEVKNVGIWFLVTMLWGQDCGYLVSLASMLWVCLACSCVILPLWYLFVFTIIVYFVLCADAVVFELMSEGSNYYSSSNGHLCDMDRCVVKTSLKFHNFGRRFYGCREWTPVSLHLCLVTLFVICHKFLHFALIDIVRSVARWWPTL